MLEPWKTGKVIKIAHVNSIIRRYWIEVLDTPIFDFKPGQFVTLDLPIHEQKNRRWRSYSIASPPDNTNVFELIIVLLEGGAGTTYLFNEVNEGSLLTLRGPVGKFTLPDPIETDIFLISTGTGIAPFRSMLAHVRNHQLDFYKIHLIFGTRNSAGILYREEMEQMAREYSNFTYDVAMSREKLDGFHHGYLHDVYMKSYQEVSPMRHFYLCGWSQMIDEAVANIILKMGYNKSQVHYELYG